MKMLAPSGVIVNVADRRAESLRRKGYKKLDAAASAAAPAAPAPRKRGRPKKTEQIAPEPAPAAEAPEESV